MRDERSQKSADAFAQLGSDLKQGVNPKNHISGDLSNLIPLKKKPQACFYFCVLLE